MFRISCLLVVQVVGSGVSDLEQATAQSGTHFLHHTGVGCRQILKLLRVSFSVEKVLVDLFPADTAHGIGVAGSSPASPPDS